MSTPNTIKRITVDLTPPKKAREDDADTGMDADHGPMHGAVQAKVLKKRSVTALDSWQFSSADLDPDMQRTYIKQLHLT